MTDYSITVDIQAPPERVWAVMTDIERWPEWTPSVRSIQRLDGGPLAPGSRARIRQPRSPAAVWEVTELQEGRSFTWVTRRPGVSATASHTVAPAPGGSRATLSIRFEGMLAPLVARMIRGLTARYLALEAAGLKRWSEGTT